MSVIRMGLFEEVMKLQSRRKLAIILALVMVLSSFTMLSASPQQPDREALLEEYLNQGEAATLEGPIRLDPDQKTSWIEDREYRVIVQLEGDAAISETIGKDEKYHELPPGIRKNIERGILGEQQGIIRMLERKGVSLEVLHNYTVVVNGFSALAQGSDLAEIKNTSGVKDVFISNEYYRPEPIETDMKSTHDMIGSEYVWEQMGYRGEGMVVAVVDTGIQWTHPDFNPDYSDYDLVIDEEWINSLDLPGRYHTPKVVYGYNYYDDVPTVENMNGNHGQHVAGTVAADGNIKGVAPKAQLVDLQVFGEEDETTFDDIYLRGIEDAMQIGVDAINMSLGAAASFYRPNSAVDQAITNAREDGVVFAISAGNSAHSLDGYAFPLRENPDIGMVGAPSLNKDSISVASVENLFATNNYLTFPDGEEVVRAPYTPAGPFNLPSEFDEEDYVFAGLGGTEEDYIAEGLEPRNDFEGLELEGKIALISRGNFPFVTKILNAQEEGAKGVIIFNHLGDELINMQYPDADGTIPAGFIGKTAGERLVELEGEVMISFPDDVMSAPNPTGGQMSGFTSWGTTPSLDMKPEVTAPGGMIYSTVLNGNYASMSGTSMAAPHVAGSTALVQQFLLNQGMDREDVAEMSKVLHMNTAQPLTDMYGNYYSPRRQGAGMIRPDKAMITPVTVVNAYDGEAKLQLRDFQEEVFTMTLEATNHSEETVIYDVEVDVIVDELIAVLMWQWMDSAPLVGYQVYGDEEVTIEPGMTETVTVTVDISNARIPAFHPAIGSTEYPVVDYPNLFIEGFIQLIEKVEDDEGVLDGIDLVVPFVGFYGDWAGEESPRILDGFQYLGEAQVFELGGFVNHEGYFMGYDPEMGYAGAADRLMLSPGNPEGNATMTPVFSLLRNAAEFSMKVYNEEGDPVKVIVDDSWIPKSRTAIPFYYIPAFTWDGTDEYGEIVDDGVYTFEMAFLPHYEDAVWQSREFMITVDATPPVVENIRYDQGEKVLSFDAYDEGVGLYYLGVYLDGELVYEPEVNDEGHYVIEDFEYHQRQNLTIYAVDKIMNSKMYEPAPFIRSNRPENVGPGYRGPNR